MFRRKQEMLKGQLLYSEGYCSVKYFEDMIFDQH